MSTILKALKRVDQTTPPPDDLQSWPPRIDTKEAVKGRLYRRWLRRRVVLGLILVVIVIAGGWLVYSQKHQLISKIWPSNRSEKAPVFKAKLQPPSRPTEGPESQEAVASNRQRPFSGVNSDQKQPRADQPVRKIPRSPRQREDQANRMTTRAPKSQAPGTTSTAKSGPSRTSVAAAKKSDQSRTRAPAGVPAPKSGTVRSYQRLDESRLKLQAIAWSHDATQRIAVINNRVVREGESIDGFSIRQIREDDVVVNDGTQSWQLEFGLR